LRDIFTILLICAVILALRLRASGAFADYFSIATGFAIGTADGIVGRHTQCQPNYPLDAPLGAGSEPHHRLDQSGPVLGEFRQALRQVAQRQDHRAEGSRGDLALTDGRHDGFEI
jgi:hypothetical protein